MSFELQPTYDNLKDNLIKDTIRRNSEMFQFIKILNIIDSGYSIAIDGKWGSGKTFFVKQVKMIIDAFNISRHIDDCEIIRDLWNKNNKNISLKQQVCVYYDAWENDNDEDPIFSLIYSILSEVEINYSFNNEKSYIDIAASILEFFTGKNFTQIIKNLKNDSFLKELKENKNIKNKIEEFLNSIIEKKGERLVVFIDELDRCKPSYAVKLLERIKHYFFKPKITFVFSINTMELQNTIKRYYGEGFNSWGYLDRFFDLRISLPPVDTRHYYRKIKFDCSLWTFDIVCNAVIKTFHFELREIAKYLKLTKIAAYNVTHNNNSFLKGKGIYFCLLYFVPVMLGLKIYNSNLYDDFIEGRDCSSVLNVLNNLDTYFFDELLEDNETYNTEDTDKIIVTISDKLKAVYDILFVKNFGRCIHEIKIGKYTFEEDNRLELQKAVSLLSEYSSYEM